MMDLHNARVTAWEHILWAKQQGKAADEILAEVGYTGTETRNWITAYDVLTQIAWEMRVRIALEEMDRAA